MERCVGPLGIALGTLSCFVASQGLAPCPATNKKRGAYHDGCSLVGLMKDKCGHTTAACDCYAATLRINLCVRQIVVLTVCHASNLIPINSGYITVHHIERHPGHAQMSGL